MADTKKPEYWMVVHYGPTKQPLAAVTDGAGLPADRATTLYNQDPAGEESRSLYQPLPWCWTLWETVRDACAIAGRYSPTRLGVYERVGGDLLKRWDDTEPIPVLEPEDEAMTWCQMVRSDA